MKNKRSWHECPQLCSGRDSSWQRQLKPGEANRIKTEDNDLELSGTEKICGYCRCVYRLDRSNHKIEVLGRHDANWEPNRKTIYLE